MEDDLHCIVSCSRLTLLIKRKLIANTLTIKTYFLGDRSWISLIESILVRFFKNMRILKHIVLKGIATPGRSAMGWSHGFKLYIIKNDKGEILNFIITQANVDDRETLKKEHFLDKIYGKFFADKGYIGKTRMEMLFCRWRTADNVNKEKHEKFPYDHVRQNIVDK